MKKLHSFIKFHLAPFLTRAGIATKIYPLTAFAFFLASSKTPENRRAFRVLCVGRSIFTDDVRALGTYCQKTQYIVIPLGYFQMIFDSCFDPADRQKILEDNYHIVSQWRRGRKKYYRYLKRFFPFLKIFIGFDAVLVGNIGYLPQQELARISEEKKVPYLVLHKEGLAIPGDFARRAALYKNIPFVGAKMLFYNNSIHEAVLSQGIHGISAKNTEVVGIPRLDFYFSDRSGKNDRRMVPFFSFYPPDKFRDLIEKDDKEKNLKAERLSEEFHRWIIEFAKNHPECKVIIKTKVASHYVDYVQKIFQKYFGHQLENLTITNAGTAAQMIRDSAVVIGYNSTVLLEGIIAGKTVVAPYFGDIVTDKPTDYFGQFPEVIHYARSYEELERYILQPEKYHNEDSKKRNEFLEQFISIPDGKASERTEKAIVQSIMDYKNKLPLNKTGQISRPRN